MGGFIPGSRGSIMLDLVVLAMVAILPVLALAIRAAQAGNYELHKKTMVILAILLVITVIAFEVEMRMVGWRHLAKPSPYYDSGVFWALGVHLLFSTTAAVSMAVTVWAALRQFPTPPVPGAHSAAHRRSGKIAAISLAGTAVSGWIFYWLAFVAR